MQQRLWLVSLVGILSTIMTARAEKLPGVDALWRGEAKLELARPLTIDADAPGGRQWHLCHFTRKDDARGPAGPFTPDPANPVIRGGDLFRKICSQPGAQCPADTVDEGTPEILGRDADGAFLVTFHGAR